MFRVIIISAAICAIAVNGQLQFRQDPNVNSYSIQTPSAQTTFTRYFGGQQGSLLEASETRQQQQQVAPAPQGYNYAAPVEDFSVQQNQLAAQQQYQQQLQQQQQAYPQQQQLQQQAQFSQQDIAAYFQQQQEAQAQQQYAQPARQAAAPQQQYAAPQQQYAAPQQQYAAPQQYAAQQAAQPAAQAQVGISYSPSNEVSNVNFASGDLKYNF